MGWVYFLHAAEVNRVKVGWSRYPVARIDAVSNASPVELVRIGTVPGSKDDECRWHRLLHAHRVRLEWFRYDWEVAATIARALRMQSHPTRLVHEDDDDFA